MKAVHMKQKLVISVLAGIMMIPGSAITANAADSSTDMPSAVPVAGIESVLTDCYENNVKQNIHLYLVKTEEGEYLNRAFSNTGDGYAYIRNAPDEKSDWIGKLYGNSTVTVLEYNKDWAKIQSGNAEGYVPVNVLYLGEEAQKHAAEYEKYQATVTADVLNVRAGQGTDTQVLTQVTLNQQYQITGKPSKGWYPIQVGEIAGWVSGEYINIEKIYSYAETKAEEEERLAREAAQKAAEEAKAAEAAMIQSQSSAGQAVIDYACQFIGNPYVWGGTSLTEGADCSGFVQSVYANFGISLPRTTWDMESVGVPVSYEEAMPGDIVLYDGHVGLYMGDGNIVNAMNEEDGIGICSATYTNIITIRRVL